MYVTPWTQRYYNSCSCLISLGPYCLCTAWGEAGFVYVSTSTAASPAGVCGVLSDASIPIKLVSSVDPPQPPAPPPGTAAPPPGKTAGGGPTNSASRTVSGGGSLLLLLPLLALALAAL